MAELRRILRYEKVGRPARRSSEDIQIEPGSRRCILTLVIEDPERRDPLTEIAFNAFRSQTQGGEFVPWHGGTFRGNPDYPDEDPRGEPAGYPAVVWNLTERDWGAWLRTVSDSRISNTYGVDLEII